jgi:hypothetical protein
MKSALLPILLVLLTSRCILAGEPWPDVPFSEVRAYAWPDDKGTKAVILKGMKLKPGAINEEGAVLTQDEVTRLLQAVNGNHIAHPVMHCNLPHNAFVFYDSAKKPVAYLEVCFTCLNHRIYPELTSRPDLLSLAFIFDAHKLPMGPYQDVSAFNKYFEQVTSREK